MFLSVVGRPQKDFDNMDGKVFLKGISETDYTKNRTYHSRFHEEYSINHLLKNGDWRKLISDNEMTLYELYQHIQQMYGLSDKTTSKLNQSQRFKKNPSFSGCLT